MKLTLKVLSIVIFGLVLSMMLPNTIMSLTSHNLKNNVQTNNTTTQMNNTFVTTEIEEKRDTAVPVNKVEQPTDNKTEEETQEPEVIEKNEEPKIEIAQATPTVSEDISLNELSEKLNRSLKSNLSGTGASFAKYATEMGVDPYLAVAIVLHETGCNWSCSSAVVNKNNVGGMYANGGLITFESLDAGIYAFISNLKRNYYDKGLTTPEAMNSKYASNPEWASKVNYYIAKLKAA